MRMGNTVSLRGSSGSNFGARQAARAVEAVRWYWASASLPSLRPAKRRSNPSRDAGKNGLLRGACHRARIRATR